MTKNTISIIILFILGSANVFAQQHVYSLQQSKELALKNNYSIKNSELSLSSSKEGKLAAQSAYLPSLSASGVLLYGFKDFIEPIAGLAPRGVNNVFIASATAVQPIYAGGKIRTSNQLAGLQVEVGEIRTKQSRDSVLLQTEQKYWQLYNINEQYKTLLFNERYLDTLYKEQSDNLKAGLIAKNDLLKIKVQKNQVKLNELKTANAYQIAILDFCRFIGTPYDSLMVLSDSAYVINSPDKLYIKPELVLKNTDNYRLLEKNVNAETLQTRLKKADYLPSLSIGVSGAQVGVIDRGLGSQFTPVALGALSIPISSWLWGEGKHVLKQHKYAEQIAQNNLADGGNQLQVYILQSWNNLSEAYAQVELLQDNLASSAENLKSTRDSYRAGLNNLSDLINAQADYQQVQSQLAEANSNYLIRLCAYKFAIGKME